MKFFQSILVFSVAAAVAPNPDAVARLSYLLRTMQGLVPSGSDSVPGGESRTALVELARKFAANEGRETDLFVDSFKIVTANGIGPDGYESVIWDALDAVFSASKKRGAEELQSDANKKQLVEDPVRSSKQVQFSPVNQMHFFDSNVSVVEQVDEPRLPVVETEARHEVVEAQFSPVQPVRRAPVTKDYIISQLERSCGRHQPVRDMESTMKYLASVAVDFARRSDWQSLGLMVDVFMGLSERFLYQLFRDAWLVMWGRETTFLSMLYRNQIESRDRDVERCMEEIDKRARRLSDARVDARDGEISDRLVQLVQNEGQARIVMRLFCLASISSIDRQRIDSMFHHSIASIRK
jgi:hypothetical protein